MKTIMFVTTKKKCQFKSLQRCYICIIFSRSSYVPIWSCSYKKNGEAHYDEDNPREFMDIPVFRI